MTRAEIISIAALLISLGSLGFSVFFNLRDRANLKATSRFSPASESGPACVYFTVVNAGRRPIILRMWGGTSCQGQSVGTFFGKEQSGLRLGEHERFDHSMEKQDLHEQTPEDEIIYADLWVEDTLGRRYSVKDAKNNLALLLES